MRRAAVVLVFLGAVGWALLPGCDGGGGGPFGGVDGGGSGADGFSGDPERTVRGRLWFEFRGPQLNEAEQIEIGPPETVPAIGVTITVVDGAGAVLARDLLVNDDGTFALELGRKLRGDEVVVFATWLGTDDFVQLAVLHPGGVGEVEPDSGTAPVWAWHSAVPAGGDVGDLVIREEDGSGALFMFVLGFSTLATVLDDLLAGDEGRLASLAILWAPGLAWTCGSCAGPYPQQLEDGATLANSIWIGGEEGGSGAWGYPVLLHELGHYVARNYSRDDSPGGEHFMSEPVVPPFAWSEGWATYFSTSTFSRWMGEPWPLYWDIQQGASFWADIARALYSEGQEMTRPDPFGGLDQDLDENYVAAMLWELWDGADMPEADADDGTALGTPVVLRAVASERFLDWDRGSGGADLVDFVDAVLCDAPDLGEPVTTTLVDGLSFPYDGEPACP